MKVEYYSQDGSYEIALTHSEMVALAVWKEIVFRAMIQLIERAVLDSSPQPPTRQMTSEEKCRYFGDCQDEERTT